MSLPMPPRAEERGGGVALLAPPVQPITIQPTPTVTAPTPEPTQAPLDRIERRRESNRLRQAKHRFRLREEAVNNIKVKVTKNEGVHVITCTLPSVLKKPDFKTLILNAIKEENGL